MTCVRRHREGFARWKIIPDRAHHLFQSAAPGPKSIIGCGPDARRRSLISCVRVDQLKRVSEIKAPRAPHTVFVRRTICRSGESRQNRTEKQFTKCHRVSLYKTWALSAMKRKTAPALPVTYYSCTLGETACVLFEFWCICLYSNSISDSFQSEQHYLIGAIKALNYRVYQYKVINLQIAKLFLIKREN